MGSLLSKRKEKYNKSSSNATGSSANATDSNAGDNAVGNTSVDAGREYADELLPVPPEPIRAPLRVVVAMYDFEARSSSELSFRKGDRLEVIDGSDENWWHTTNKRTKETGYIPASYVAASTSLMSQDWYYGDVERVEAEQLLLESWNGDGAFLVRKSKAGHSFTISVKVGVGKVFEVKHYRVRSTENNRGFYVVSGIVFQTLSDLIENLMYSSDHTLASRIKDPCVRKKPQPPFDHYEVSRELLRHIKLIGQGSFGEVWLSSWNNLQDVAVKSLKEGSMSTDQFLEEANIMKGLVHPNIIRLYAVCTQEQPILIITEYMPQGALLNYLKEEENRSRLGLDAQLYIAKQVACGMAYLENQDLVHRDLAARNVLVGEGLLCKVADFGLARVIKDDEYSLTTSVRFPIKWTPPEVFLHNRYTTKSDVWSFGILLIEIVTLGGPPYPGMSKENVMRRVIKGYRMAKPQGCPEPLYELMYKCWNFKPEDRPVFDFISEFLENYNVQHEVSYSTPE